MTVPPTESTRSGTTTAERLILDLRIGDLEPQGEAGLRVAVLESEAAPGSGVEAWGFTAGALGRSHGLIERIGERIESDSIREVVVPGLEAQEMKAPGDRLALIAAAVSAASVHEVLVRIGDEEPRSSGDAFRWLRERLRSEGPGRDDSRTVTAVISAWNKYKDVRANLLGIRAQVRPFDDVVVVDNHSSDGTAQMIRADFPEVRLVVMPNSAYGACETFNVGFSTALTEYIAVIALSK